MVDIPKSIMFGTWEDNPFDKNGRGFTSKDITAVPQYLNAFNQYAADHDIYRRAHELYELEEPDHHRAEQIDQDITRACQHAENQCRRLRKETTGLFHFI